MGVLTRAIVRDVISAVEKTPQKELGVGTIFNLETGRLCAVGCYAYDNSAAFRLEVDRIRKYGFYSFDPDDGLIDSGYKLLNDRIHSQKSKTRNDNSAKIIDANDRAGWERVGIKKRILTNLEKLHDSIAA